MPHPIRLVIGTSNPGKAREFSRLLRVGPWRLESLEQYPATSPARENAPSMRENAKNKAMHFAQQLGQWVLADDTGLEVAALEGAPGVQTARFAGPRATAADNRQRLLDAMHGAPWSRRDARFVCHLALTDPNGALRAEARGICRGRIRIQPSGSGGFGYDSLLEILEYHRTLAELSDVVVDCVSHRACAVRALLPRLRELLT